MKTVSAALVTLCLVAGAAGADDNLLTVYPADGDFDDATFAVESAITDRGLVIDFVSHVGAMLSRTGADVGSSKPIFEQADIFLFCSAVVSRQVMEADPDNIAHCPYGIFVREFPGPDGKVEIGFRNMPGDAMATVQALLDAIAKEATGID
ncbi:MAG: DUF302 domain-containing protein [Pseudomonadota bacterium]